jgi:anaerobic magnesium-protoporphyrin IX monomethyl ester cyclase
MRTVLVFPPEWRYLKQPYLSLPSLTAYLRQHGCWVRQYDLNLAFHEHSSSLEGLAPLHSWAVERFGALDRADSLNSLEQRLYADLAWAALQPLEAVIEEMAWSFQVLRSKRDFYDLNKCWQAFRLQDKLWDLPRAMLTDTTASSVNRARYPEYSSTRAMALAESNDETRNPFLAYLRRQALPDILADSPDLVGISLAVSGQIIPALTLARLLKEERPELHVTVGGNICTLLQEVLPSRPQLLRYFDSVIIYEGELPLLTLIQQLENGGDLAQVPSLLYLREGQFQANPIAAALDINTLPAPDFDDLPLDRYRLPELLLPLLSSRDCYWKRCAFCSQSQAYTAYRCRHGNLVVDDMEKLADKYGTRFLSFSDQSIAPETLGQVADELLARGRHFHWHCLARLERQLSPELCRRAAAAGCKVLTFGLETANERLAQFMDKGVTTQDALRVLRHSSEAGIVNRATVFFGFPTETLAEAEETINFILAQDQIIHAVVSQSYDLGRLSPVARNLDRFQVQLTADPDQDLAVLYENYHVPVGMSRQESALQSRRLWQRLRERFPAFAATYLLELPLYVAHYGDYSRLVKVVERAVDQTGDKSSDGYPRRRRGVVCVDLRFDLAQILAQGEMEEGLELSLAPKQSRLILDCRWDRALRLAPLAWQVLDMADGTADLATMAEAVAQQFDLDRKVATVSCQGLLSLYRAFID